MLWGRLCRLNLAEFIQLSNVYLRLRDCHLFYWFLRSVLVFDFQSEITKIASKNLWSLMSTDLRCLLSESSFSSSFFQFYYLPRARCLLLVNAVDCFFSLVMQGERNHVSKRSGCMQFANCGYRSIAVRPLMVNVSARFDPGLNSGRIVCAHNSHNKILLW